MHLLLLNLVFGPFQYAIIALLDETAIAIQIFSYVLQPTLSVSTA